ncbi:MAG: hypothetical protein R6V04_01395 [bacterium]
MQSKHLTEEEIQIIAEANQVTEDQREHLLQCSECAKYVKLYQIINSTLATAPEYDTSHLTSKSVIKKIKNNRFSYLLSPKIDICFIIFLFITAVVVAFIFTDLLSSLQSFDLSVILKVFTENEYLKSAFNTLTSHSQLLLYIPFVLLALFVTLFFEKILSTLKHGANHT